jgi:hypothetical protein
MVAEEPVEPLTDPMEFLLGGGGDLFVVQILELS